MGCRFDSLVNGGKRRRLAGYKLTMNYELFGDLFQKFDDQDVVVVRPTMILANRMVVGVCWT